MRFEQLRVFLAVLDTGSLASAGRLLHMSQPSVTASLNTLEQDLGQRLLDRAPGQRRPIAATEAGAIFADYARKALADYRSMLSAITFQGDRKPSPLRLGVTATPGSSLIPVLVDRFRKAHPAVPVQIRTYRGFDLVRLLQEGDADIAVTGTDPQADSVILERFFYDPLVLIAPVSMGLTGPLSLRKLKQLPLIIRDPAGNLMQRLVRGLKRAGLSLDQMNVVMQVSGNNDVLSSVAFGAGVGFVCRSLLAATKDNHDIAVLPVSRLKVERYVYMLRHKSSPFSGSLRLFWEYALGTEWRENVFSYNTMMI